MRWFAARLSIAIEDTRRLGPMSFQDFREAFKDIPGVETLQLSRAANGNQIITIGNKAVEVGPMASNDEIRLALLNPFIRTENTRMSITGLQSGAFQDKLAEMRRKIADTETRGLAKIDTVVADGVAKLDEAAAGAAAKAQKEIDDALQEFAAVTNGGPV